ncbi:MAG: hypothetical protein WDW36_009839 [Sanguina aurantia]
MEAADAVRGLVSHYSALRPRKMDLLHDMAESEVFLVDGEALLMEALRDSRCDLSHQGQPLQLLYWVEALCVKLRRAGGLFHVAFFASYDAVWARQPPAAALRALLQRHLSASAAVSVTRHSSPAAPGFAQHLAALQPTFVLTSDALAADLLAAFPPPESDEEGVAVVAASLAGLGTTGAATAIDTAGEDPLTPVLAVQALTLASIMQVLSLRVNVAYLSALQFNSLTMYGFLASSDKAYALLANRAASISAVTQRVCEYATQGGPPATAPLAPWEPPRTRSGGWVGGWGRGEEAESAWLARVWLLHLALLPQLSLEQRALQALPAAGDAAMAAVMASPPVKAFLHSVLLTLTAAAAALPLTPVSAVADGESEEDSDEDELDDDEFAARAAARQAAREAAAVVLRAQQHELADSYDGRLFARLLLLLHVQGQLSKPMSDPLGLPEQAELQLQAAVSALAVAAGGAPEAAAAVDDVMASLTHPPASLCALLEPVAAALLAAVEATATAAAIAAAAQAGAAAAARMSDSDDSGEDEEDEGAGGGFVDAVLDMCGARDKFDAALLSSPDTTTAGTAAAAAGCAVVHTNRAGHDRPPAHPPLCPRVTQPPPGGANHSAAPEEATRWSSRTELEPAYWTGAKDDAASKQLWAQRLMERDDCLAYLSGRKCKPSVRRASHTKGDDHARPIKGADGGQDAES